MMPIHINSRNSEECLCYIKDVKLTCSQWVGGIKKVKGGYHYKEHTCTASVRFADS